MPMSVSFAGCGAIFATDGRSLDSVVQQYLETVRPMHLEFVEPGRRFADIVIPEGGKNEAAMDLLVQWLATKVQKSETNVS